MNKSVITGRTVKELELRKTQGGTSVIRFTLAVDRRKKDDGTDFIQCVAYGKVAELMDRYVRKGHKVGIIGHIQTGRYDKEGKTIYTTEVIVDELEFLEKKQSDDFTPVESADLPF